MWKAEANLRKHGVRFANAMEAFEDLMGRFNDDDRGPEMRHTVIGRDALGRILLVVYTWRGGKVRIISARKATAKEKRAYHRGL